MTFIRAKHFILILAIATLGFAAAVSPAHAAEGGCGGCNELQVAAEKARKFAAKSAPEDNPEATRAVLEDASKAMKKMPRAKGEKLSPLQVREVVNLLRATARLDEYQLIVEDNTPLLKANIKDIQVELKKLPPDEAKLVLQNIFVVVNEDASGNDPAAKPTKAPKHK